MALRMTSPCKPAKNGVYYFRKRVPADLVAQLGKREVKFSLGTKDPTEAKQLCRDADLRVTREWRLLRSPPEVLPLKTIIGLAGKAYDRFVQQMDAEPGEPDIWEAAIARAQMEADAGNLENWYGPTADSLLLEFGRKADATSRTRLLEEIHKAIQQAARLNYQKAQGDYRPDPDAKRFPAISEQTTAPRADTVSFNSLLHAWRRSRVSAQASTVLEWERTIEDFKKFVGHDDAARVTKVNVRRWVDSLLEERGLTPRTVKEKKLAALRSTYRAAINKLLVHDDPTRGIVVDVPKRQVLRAKGFTDDEARRILIAALQAEKSAPTAGAVLPVAFRWVPWLCAYTGARGGEVAQLRSQDVMLQGDIPYIRITPEAGAVKAGVFRHVPLHPYLVEQGFLLFARHAKPGPLFYRGSDAKGKIYRPWDNVRDKVGEWTRQAGNITDKSIQPTHAWRHRFKTLCRKFGVELAYANAIQGHAEPGAAAGYGEIPLEALYREIKKLPRFPEGAA